MNRIRLFVAGREITDFAPNEPVTVGDYKPPEPAYQYTHKPTGVVGAGTSPEAAMMDLASNLQDAGINAQAPQRRANHRRNAGED